MVYVQDINGKPLMPTTDQTGSVASRRSCDGDNEMEVA